MYILGVDKEAPMNTNLKYKVTNARTGETISRHRTLKAARDKAGLLKWRARRDKPLGWQWLQAVGYVVEEVAV